MGYGDLQILLRIPLFLDTAVVLHSSSQIQLVTEFFLPLQFQSLSAAAVSVLIGRTDSFSFSTFNLSFYLEKEKVEIKFFIVLFQ